MLLPRFPQGVDRPGIGGSFEQVRVILDMWIMVSIKIIMMMTIIINIIMIILIILKFLEEWLALPLLPSPPLEATWSSSPGGRKKSNAPPKKPTIHVHCSPPFPSLHTIKDAFLIPHSEIINSISGRYQLWTAWRSAWAQFFVQKQSSWKSYHRLADIFFSLFTQKIYFWYLPGGDSKSRGV